jgi:alpha-tubulin suppressor-like RCC1 family protein
LPATAFASVRAGELFSCGIAADSTAYCWGTDRFGEMGTGGVGTGVKPTPVPVVAPGIHWAGLSAGKSNFTFSGTCSWTAAGAAYCWGSNSSGQLGSPGSSSTVCGISGAPSTCTGVPIRVQTSEHFIAIAQGGEHVCGLTDTHSVSCWGLNSYGALGNGTNANQATPTAVVDGPRTP